MMPTISTSNSVSTSQTTGVLSSSPINLGIPSDNLNSRVTVETGVTSSSIASAIISSSSVTSSVSSSAQSTLSSSAPLSGRMLDVEAEINISPEEFVQWMTINRKIEAMIAKILNRSFPVEVSNQGSEEIERRNEYREMIASQDIVIENQLKLLEKYRNKNHQI